MSGVGGLFRRSRPNSIRSGRSMASANRCHVSSVWLPPKPRSIALSVGLEIPARRATCSCENRRRSHEERSSAPARASCSRLRRRASAASSGRFRFGMLAARSVRALISRSRATRHVRRDQQENGPGASCVRATSMVVRRPNRRGGGDEVVARLRAWSVHRADIGNENPGRHDAGSRARATALGREARFLLRRESKSPGRWPGLRSL